MFSLKATHPPQPGPRLWTGRPLGNAGICFAGVHPAASAPCTWCRRASSKPVLLQIVKLISYEEHKLKPPGWYSLSHFCSPQPYWGHGSPPVAWGRTCSAQPLCKSSRLYNSNDLPDKEMSLLLGNKINMFSIFFCRACAYMPGRRDEGMALLMCCRDQNSRIFLFVWEGLITYHVSKGGVGPFFYHIFTQNVFV